MGLVNCETCGASCVYHDDQSTGNCGGRVRAINSVTNDHGDMTPVHICEAHEQEYWHDPREWW